MSLPIHRLSNGVRVVCDPMPGLETVALSVVYGAGARFEPKNRSGWAHLLEHMAFKAAGGRSAAEIARTTEAAGVQLNAETSYERTSYQMRGLASELALGMATIADMTQRPDFLPDELEREKDVVGQEIAEARDTPDDHVFDLAQTKCYDGALGRPILGTVQSLKSATRETMEAWRQALYAPERTVISVAGALDEDEVLRLAESSFGHVQPTGAVPQAEPQTFIGGVAVQARRIEQANLVWILPGPDSQDEAWYAARLFSEILGGGMASRLFQKAREDRGLAYTIYAWCASYEGAGQIGVFAGSAAESAEPLGALVAEQILEMGEGVSNEELARGKAQLETSLFMARESPLGRAERAAAQTLLFDRILSPEETRAGVEAVTVEDLRKLVADTLAPRLTASATLGPKAAGGAGTAFTSRLFGN
ncbi:MAG TPA: pitrilysin family protein [Caulobacteraceae bacterium]|jgi:predicted Zn-dependent peptidase|nr:pitrilysin family protein [Caulobacteraceae bacterium]